MLCHFLETIFPNLYLYLGRPANNQGTSSMRGGKKAGAADRHKKNKKPSERRNCETTESSTF